MGVLDDLPPPTSSLDDLPPPAPDATWLGAAKGVGQAGLALGAGALRGISNAANDILPDSNGSRAAVAKEIAQDPILNYRGGPEAQPIMSTLEDLTRPIAKVGSAIHQGIADFTSPRTADVASDLLTLAPGARGAFSRGEPLVQQGHPLTSAAESEAANLKAHASAAEAQGLSLPGREVSAPQAYMDNAARRDLTLPSNAPVTSGLLDAADKQNVSPGFDAAKKFDAPLVETSQQGRSVARGLFQDAENMNLTYAQRTAARTEAQANWKAAKDAEAAFREKATAAGQPELADNWDAARVYKAKLETWRDALDGAGHVIGPKIRKAGLSDEPLSGPLQEAASVAAQYPELFRGTQLQTPKPGIARKGAAALAPVAGATLGGVLGGGTGALAGELAGRGIGRKILGQ